MNPAPKILVTGCNGFIGRRVATTAISRGMQLTGLSLHAASIRHINDTFENLVADISDFESLAGAIGSRRFDYVINCSGYIDHKNIAQGGSELFDTHFTGLMNLVKCVQHDGLKGFVQLGSSDEYGGAPSPQHEDLREAPISPYACAKVAACHLIQMLHRTEGFPGIVARLFLVYGPGQNMHRFLPQIITGCIENKSFPVSGGEQIRDFCYIDDVVDALLRLVKEERTQGEIFNIASGTGTQIRTMIELIQDSVGRGNPMFGEIPYRSGENMSLIADIEKITATTGWRPTTSLQSGVGLTVRWFRDRVGK
ncbi:MAG: NAD-dependent epimerase/dehydratase family protein [Arenicellales bacterium]